MMRLQKMSEGTGLLATLEEDLGLSNLATKNDQRTCASFCHLELIRYELGFPDMLEEDFLVSHPGIPMRMARCDERFSLGSRSDRNPGLCATGFSLHTGGIATTISNIREYLGISPEILKCSIVRVLTTQVC